MKIIISQVELVEFDIPVGKGPVGWNQTTLRERLEKLNRDEPKHFDALMIASASVRRRLAAGDIKSAVEPMNLIMRILGDPTRVHIGRQS